ncbi:1-phosphofructokinase [Salinimicrobium tongyeongense]|uniref:1-phosphofructokinase n=1 Tax=Salinimicrobium tongyeongense TaxID=2809707 RepID=A0ABY6NS94_9FLAO|nr:PfkB family carbohydrate kinase [Salinimicrobium tongyeongense]UZH55413.1 1-phosphofructokinase [Salinimicrobium tongyeongense]
MILSVCPNPSVDTYAWIDTFKTGGVNRIERVEEFPGGKGVHVALALAELGNISNLMGAWAGGAGNWIKGQCVQKNATVLGIELEGNNRKCYTFRSGKSEMNNSELLEPGPEFTSQKWHIFKEFFQDAIGNTKVICMAGSWPVNAPVDAYAQLIEAAKKQNVPVVLDCTGIQLKEALKKGFFGLHLNQEEAKNLCGSEDIQDVMKFLSGKVEMVALTRGKDGLVLAYQNRVLTANVKIDRVVSAVGSGDCLTAGLAHAISRDLSIEETAAYGVACGASNCLFEDLGQLKIKDVKSLLQRVEIKEIIHEV